MTRINKYGLTFIIALISIVLIGTFGYYFIEENWSIFDGLYMTIITITTVGFAETHQLSTIGRIFTMVILILGFGIIATAASSFMKLLVENEFSGVIRRRQMQKRISKLENHYIICGFGRIGGTIATELDASNIDFVIVEIEAELLELAKQRNYHYIEGTAEDDAALIAAGIERASGIAVCTANEAENLFITLAARELNPNLHVIVRSDNPSIEQRILRAGANRVAYPMRLGGEQIANMIKQETGVPYTKSTTDTLSSSIMGHALKKYTLFDNEKRTIEFILRKTNTDVCLALETTDQQTINHPPSDHEVSKGDTLLLVSANPTADFVRRDKDQLIQWDESLSMGIPSIDVEHKQLVHAANDLACAIVDGEGAVNLKVFFDKLLDYTNTHFKNEEALFDEYDYPEKEEHKKEHDRLRQHVIEFNREKDVRFASNMVEFLESWLFDHILGSDFSYANFLKSRDVQ